MKPKCHLQAYYVKCRLAKWWRERILYYITIFDNYAALWKCLMLIKPAFICSKIQKNCNIVKYYYNLKEYLSILIYFKISFISVIKARFTPVLSAWSLRNHSRVNPISLSYPFPLPLPLSFARSGESKGYPNSRFDGGLGTGIKLAWRWTFNIRIFRDRL